MYTTHWLSSRLLSLAGFETDDDWRHEDVLSDRSTPTSLASCSRVTGRKEPAPVLVYDMKRYSTTNRLRKQQRLRRPSHSNTSPRARDCWSVRCLLLHSQRIRDVSPFQTANQPIMWRPEMGDGLFDDRLGMLRRIQSGCSCRGMLVNFFYEGIQSSLENTKS
jgi:hypothetical protein